MATKRNWHPRHGKRQVLHDNSSETDALHICILGASLSGLAAVNELLRASVESKITERKIHIHIFQNLYDPAEPAHSYGHALKPFVDYVPERLGPARERAFADQLLRWEQDGFVEKDYGVVVEIQAGETRVKPGERYRPKGGLHQMCARYADSLAERSTKQMQVSLRHEQPWSLCFQEGHGWDVNLGAKGPVETFGFVLINYDFSMRIHHVKAIRELLDSGMPHTSDLMACFGNLHASKSICLAFSVEPPLGDFVPWSAAVVNEEPTLCWVSRVAPCSSLAWQRSGGEHWMAFSTSAFSKQRFGPGWDKDGVGKEITDTFIKVCGEDSGVRRIRFHAKPYHWDLPVPRNRPVGQTGLIADAAHHIAWTGDFCVEPTSEGAWLAGCRAGQILSEAFCSRDGLNLSKLPCGDVLLPKWEYHLCRKGDEDLAAIALSARPADSAYRGTCNWEATEKIMAERFRAGALGGTDALWLDHLPKVLQQKFSSTCQKYANLSPFDLPIQVDASQDGLRIAIVGSGPAAFYCAERLAELAQSKAANLAQCAGAVQLFRSRSKLSASQMENDHNTVFPREGDPFFDYGCQYVTASSDWFRGKMRSYEQAGICHQWEVGVLSAEFGFEAVEPSQLGWAGAAGMWKFQEAVVEQIASAHRCVLKVHNSVAVWPPKPGQRFPDQSPLVCEKFHKHLDGTWTLENGYGDTYGPFDVLVGAFASHNHIQAQLSASPATRRMRDYLHDNLAFSPVITAMVIFERSLGLSFNAAFVVGDRRLAWMSNNNAKVSTSIAFRAQGREFWTFMAPAKYSHESFERDAKGYKRRAFQDFVDAVSELTGCDAWKRGPQLVRALHWEAGLPCTTLPSEAGCIFDDAQSLGWCGHWATYGGIEGAALSGRQMADMIARLSKGEAPPPEAVYPPGQWPDIGVHTPHGSVRLGHGCFAVQHPRLRSIDAPGVGSSLSAKDTEAFWRPLKAWGYGGDARSKGQDPNSMGNGYGGRDVSNGKQPHRPVAKRWNRSMGA